jgi:transcriptional regulator with XRE-family HTH domain
MGTVIKSIHSTQYQMLISWLKDAREAQGLTMRDLAKKLEVPHSFVGKVEQCERRIDVIEYMAYCRALELSPVDGIEFLLIVQEK